ncbi:hypothetical protein GCM10023191_014250 [Actinoallomurus oryzae]|uniref:Uncharacterized protein n=2 Tax=Actinoallomurus oryzae TaxID=502180 RepID=A0ABP8PHZ2_9ACTN
MWGYAPYGDGGRCRNKEQEDTMHPEIVRALMTTRVHDDHRTAAAWRRRARVRRRPRALSRYPRPRPVWSTKTA